MANPATRRARWSGGGAVLLVLVLGHVLGVAAGCKREPRDPGSAPARDPIAITATLDGAAAEAIERDVVIPLEAAVAALGDATAIRSLAEHGRGVVVVELGRADALAAVREAVRDALRKLPAELPPPVIERGDPDAPPVMALTLTSDTSVLARSELARAELVPRLERLPGVAGVALVGEAEPAVIVRLDVARLTAYGVTVADVQTAIAGAVTVPPGGSAAAPRELATLLDVELARKGGAAVRLGDVAAIQRGIAARPEVGLVPRPEAAGDPLRLAIHAQPGADPAQVVAAVRAAALPALLPAGWSLVEAPVAAQPHAIALAIHGPEWALLSSFAGELEQAMRARPALFAAVASNRRPDDAERAVVPDGDAAVRLGVAPAELATTLRGLLVGPGRLGAARIQLRLGDRDALEPDALGQLRLRGIHGELVPLASMARMIARTTPTLTRRDRERAITISADLAAGQTRATVEPKLAELTARLPAGYRAVVLPPARGAPASSQ